MTKRSKRPKRSHHYLGQGGGVASGREGGFSGLNTKPDTNGHPNLTIYKYNVFEDRTKTTFTISVKIFNRKCLRAFLFEAQFATRNFRQSSLLKALRGRIFADSVLSLFSPLVLTMGELPQPLYLLIIFLSSSSSLSSLFSSTFLAADKGAHSSHPKTYLKGLFTRWIWL